VPASAFAQNKVTGTVSDVNRSPLSGVQIAVPNTAVGTISGRDGRYSVSIPEGAGQTLVFTLPGFESDTVQVGTRSLINVSLTESSNALQEMIVVGYGSMRRNDITGSLTSVKINDNEAASVTSFDRLIQGRAAGVQVTSGSAAPGGAVELKIRGTSSFNSSSQPLYVVDGILMADASQDTPQIGGVNNSAEKQNPLTAINPADIQDIQILKDASATAIYGAQGANGVVLITTKSGTSAKPRIEYQSTYQWSYRAKTLPMLDVNSFAAWRNELGTSQVSPDTVVGINWQDFAMRTAKSTNQRVSISGKTDKVNYLVSGSFSNGNGIIKQTGLNVGTLRLNLDNTISKWVKVGTRSSFSYVVNNMTQGTEPNGGYNTSMTRQMLSTRPFMGGTAFDVFDPDLSTEGPLVWFRQFEDRSRTYNIMPSLYGEVTILKGLTFRSTFGASYTRKMRTRSYGYDLNAGSLVGGKASISTTQSLRYNLDNMFNFNYKIGKYHNLSGVAGMTTTYQYTQNSALESHQFPTLRPSYPNSAIDWGSDAILMGTDYSTNEVFSQPKTTMLSYLPRAVYSFHDRYILTATFRADGSSKFLHLGNKYDYFPSFAFAWRASDEAFIKQFKFIDNLKVRAGWGRVGNQSSLQPYQTLPTYAAKSYSSPYGGYVIGVQADILANPDLIWETAESWNGGLDISLFQNRLNATVDGYQKRTRDLLQKIVIPGNSGYPTMWVNRGEIRNLGLEIAVDGTPVKTKSFSVSLGGNISFNRNKIMDTGQPLGQFGTIPGRGFLGTVVTNSTYMKKEANIFLEGRPVALFYGFKTKGIVQATDVGTAPLGYNEVAPEVAGRVYYVDQDNDGKITDADLTIIGNPNPKFTGGLFLNITYRKFSLDANFNGVYGNDVLNGNLIIENDNSAARNIRAKAYFQAWRPNAPSNTYPALGQSPSGVPILDRYIEDGSFLRLSNLTLSYRFKIRQLSWLKGANVSLSGNNLLIISNYSGWDPEVNSFSFDPLRVGIDWGSYPPTRSIILGFGLTF